MNYPTGPVEQFVLGQFNFLHVYNVLVMPPIASPPTSPLDPSHPISVKLLFLSLPMPFPGSWLGLFGDPFSLTRAICVGWVLDWKLNWRYPLVISGRLWRQWLIILSLIHIPSKSFSLAARDSPAPFPSHPCLTVLMQTRDRYLPLLDFVIVVATSHSGFCILQP